MRPIAPRTGAPEVTIAEEQDEYMPVTVGVYDYSNGRVILWRYTFTAEERVKIAEGEDVYIGQLYPTPAPITPMLARCGPAEFIVDTDPPSLPVEDTQS